jgi:hypothetical protein
MKIKCSDDGVKPGRKSKRKLLERKFVIIELALIGILVWLYFSARPVSIYPASGMVINEFDFNFEIENADEIVIARDAEFNDPIIIKEGKDVVLIPGTYYWKAVSLLGESEVRNFTIKGSLVLSLVKEDEGYRVVNRGNVDSNVTKGDENAVIEKKDSRVFDNENESVEGRQA